MALAAADSLSSKVCAGVVVGPRGAGTLPPALEWIEGAHPEPDERSLRAAERAAATAFALPKRSGILLVLLSGGGSSMLAHPVEGVTLAEKQATVDALSRSGAPIADINCVRRHLSLIKGGWLAMLAFGECLTLAISDVHDPADDPSVIASGPTAADPSTFADALAVIARAGIQPPAAVVSHLERGAAGAKAETVKPDDPWMARARFDVIANRWTAMRGADEEARRRGYATAIVARASAGNAAEAGRTFVEDALRPGVQPGVCVIASGETTVHVRGHGRGGRNQEFALGAVNALAQAGVECVLCSIGTDGIDGPTDAAGAIVGAATRDAAAARGLDLQDSLARNDAYPALAALDALVRTGPTLTNVGDLHVLLTAKSSL
jgi:glycerate-2-kinase